jgi:hypothetical protein
MMLDKKDFCLICQASSSWLRTLGHLNRVLGVSRQGLRRNELHPPPRNELHPPKGIWYPRKLHIFWFDSFIFDYSYNQICKITNIIWSQILPCRPRKQILLNIFLGLSGRCLRAPAKASSSTPPDIYPPPRTKIWKFVSGVGEKPGMHALVPGLWTFWQDKTGMHGRQFSVFYNVKIFLEQYMLPNFPASFSKSSIKLTLGQKFFG